MTYRYLWLAFFVISPLFAEDPWGRDASLTYFSKNTRPIIEEKCDGPGVRMMRTLVRFHKGVISPADGPRSHYKPSSSEYMLQAVEKYGFLYGYLLGCDRLMRENKDPWIYRTVENKDRLITKWDPVK